MAIVCHLLSMMDNVFQFSNIKTPLGDMTAIAGDTHLMFLEFSDSRNYDRKMKKMNSQFQVKKSSSLNSVTSKLQQELNDYFDGNLFEFKTPIAMEGTDFQQSTWQELVKIPYGETRSYKQQAISLNKPSAVRAVANANGMNQIAILIPCHRIIGSNGSLTGYAGGVDRKEWLLNHEQKSR